MFPRFGILFAVLVSIGLISAADNAPSQVAQAKGAIVETVSIGSAAERAGLAANDLLQSWTCGDSKGEIESPFGLLLLEIEQAPRGPVVLQGLRGRNARSWTLGSQSWGLQTRPSLPEALLSAYQESKTLANTGKADEASQRWQTAIDQTPIGSSSLSLSWILFQAAIHSGNQADWHNSDLLFQSALKDTAEPFARILILRGLAETFSKHADWTNAEKYYRKAFDESQAVNPKSLLAADTLDGLALSFYRNQDLDSAEKYYSSALEIQQDLASESLALARSLNGLGNVAQGRGDLPTAERYHEQALAIREKISPGSLDVAASLGNLGILAQNRNDFAKAEDYLFRCLEIQKKLAPESLDVPRVLGYLGIVAWYRGDLMEAEQYHLQSLALRTKIAPNSIDVAASLENLGLVSFDRGDLIKAEAYFSQALAIQKKLVPETIPMAGSLDNLGNIACDLHDWTKCRQYYLHSLAIKQKWAPGSLDVARTLDNLGIVSRERGSFVQAGNYARRALALQQKLTPESLATADSLGILGDISRDRGYLTKAQDYYSRSLAIRKNLAPASQPYAECLASLGTILLRKGQPEAAAPLFEQALNVLENQIAHLGGTGELRAGFREQHASYYKDYIDLLLKRQQPEEAFHVLERWRARSFLEMLAERDLVFGPDLPPEVRATRQQNAAAYNRAEADLLDLDPAKDRKQIQELTLRLRDLQTEQQQIVEHIKQSSPQFAALEYPEPFDVPRARASLDSGTVLVSYEIGKKSSLIFVLQPQNITQGFAAIPLPIGETALRARITALRKAILGMDSQSQEEFRLQSHQFYKLLVRPIESLIAPAERIVICPDGPLHVLPFPALLRSRNQFLTEWKPLHITLSATVYAELKKRRHEGQHENTQLVAFGDPQYPAANLNGINRTRDSEFRNARQRGFAFVPLPYSKVEVNAIAGLFPRQSQVFLADQATEERAKQVGKDVQYLHFATHAVVDERLPLNSALALTIPENPTEGQENGLLQAWEIFEQIRIDANLVTLSACDTGLGKEMGGEGLIGLTRAFQYAGAHSVLASLWSIPDMSTAEFMKRFYRYLTSGKSKDQALRLAQRDFLRLPQFRRPFYWAAFSLNGDWR